MIGCGTVFKITREGALTTLYSFCSQRNCADGAAPYAGVVQATDGNFYGTASEGGAGAACSSNDCGTVFKITAGGNLTTLYGFCNVDRCADGENPFGVLLQATDGSFYGTTAAGGGVENAGTVFKLSVGLAPFVQTVTTSGKVGATVEILGSNLTGSTAVNFNGTAATFSVVSNTEIKATVPSGATTGFVTVTAPSGNLKSNKEFRVAGAR
jgi:uncharacterized repeat protein (TIGR03803 family)